MKYKHKKIVSNNGKFILSILNLIIILSRVNITSSEDTTNKIINREELTSIIRYSLADTSTSYATVGTTPLGNLICSASYYNALTIKYYYGLKENGRPYFKDANGVETEFISTDSDVARNEGNIFGIQLKNSGDDKEYIIAISNNAGNFELYDFSGNTPVVYKINGQQFFGSGYNSFKYVSIFKLTNADNTYLLSVPYMSNTDWNKHFYAIKLEFTSPDIANNNPINNKYDAQSLTGENKIFFSSCFETITSSYYIICFYIDQDKKYTIVALNYNLVYQNSINIDNTLYEEEGDIFYKAVHFNGYIGAFLYFNLEGNICIKFIKFHNSILVNYFDNLDLIQIANNDYSKKVQNSDFIKIVNKKICYFTISNDNEKLHLFIIQNIYDDKFVIRHYSMNIYEKNNFKFGQELRISLFKEDFIALATVGFMDNSETSFSYFILFSYPNSTDFELDITENIMNFEIPIINFNEKCKIENNIFGYEPIGVQILNDIPTEFNLLTEAEENENEELIEKNTIFNKNAKLILNENYDLSLSYRLEYTMVLKNPDYNLYKDYSEFIDTYCTDCNEQGYYSSSTNHVGRTSYCDIIIDVEKITKDCYENCFLCDKNNKKCYLCKNNFWISENDIKKCTNITIMTTIITTLPTTIITTVPTTIITTIPQITSILTELISSNLIEELTDKIKNCTIDQIVNNECSDGCIDNIDQIEQIKNKLLNNYNNTNIIISTETVIIQLSTLEDQKDQENSTISNIDLGQCEDILRDTNNLSDEEDLIIYKTDIKTSDLSTTYVTYEVYDSNLNKLNLSICSSVQIVINVPVQLDENLDGLAKSLEDSGYNLFDENDSFYNDICATYTNQNGTDMLLSDRKQDIYSLTQNQSICQADCELESYNSTTKKAKCNCQIQTTTKTIETLNIDNLFNKNEIVKSFYVALTNSNFKVMKCFKLIFDFSNFFKNYGEIMMSVLILLFIIPMIIYFILGKKNIHEFLLNILKLKYQQSNKHLQHKNKNNFDNESEPNSETKKIANEENNKNKKQKKLKRIIFSNINLNFPPKKKNNNTKSEKNLKGNDIKNIIKRRRRSIASSVEKENSKNKIDINNHKSYQKHKNKDNISDKIKNIKFKIYDKTELKKNILETDAINKNEIQVNNNKIHNFTDTELDDLNYEEAILYDKRTFMQFYWCVLKTNQLIIFTFIPTKDYNLIYVKIALFIISFALFFTINGFFFTDATMHKVYKNNGFFDIISQLPQIFYSSIISSIANILLKNLSLSENNILELKSEKILNLSNAKKKARQIEKCLKVKLLLFFIISLILMLFFWYFISCFCAVYKNTQIILIKDTGISFGTSMVYPFILSFLPGIFRIPSLRAKDKNMKCLYKIGYVANWLI